MLKYITYMRNLLELSITNFVASINQSFIILFSKENTITNKYNEIKLKKTNKTLRNNLAYYVL